MPKSAVLRLVSDLEVEDRFYLGDGQPLFIEALEMGWGSAVFVDAHPQGRPDLTVRYSLLKKDRVYVYV